MGKIRVCSYDPKWEWMYHEEKKCILSRLAEYIAKINHVGSTSIRNMPAKPIIDICIESKIYPPNEQINLLLADLGYLNMGEFGVSGRIWFKKIIPHAYNMHWCPLGGEVPQSQMNFKHILSNNKSLAEEYAALKISLSDVYEEGSLEYNKKKAPFILKVLGIREN